MRLLVADKMELSALEELKVLGIRVESRPELTKETLPAALEGIGILVVRSTEVTAKAIEAGRQLNLIVRAGAGVNTIDVAAASARGIYVANCPGRSTLPASTAPMRSSAGIISILSIVSAAGSMSPRPAAMRPLAETSGS